MSGADSAPSSQEAGAPDWFMLITVSLLSGLSDWFRDRYWTRMINMAGRDLQGLQRKGGIVSSIGTTGAKALFPFEWDGGWI